jgi:hypothetical protein
MNILEESRPLAEFYPDAQERSRAHYAFAHRFLPHYAHQNPMRAVLLNGTDPTRFIQARWQMFEDVAGLRPYGDTPERLLFRRVTDLTAWHEFVGGHPALVIQMPVPEGPACAFYLTVVLLVSESAFQAADAALRAYTPEAPEQFDQRLLAPLRTAPCRYFTLEKSLGLEGTAEELKLGILCEWTRDGSHCNFGVHLPATREAFTDVVARALALGSDVAASATSNPESHTISLPWPPPSRQPPLPPPT